MDDIEARFSKVFSDVLPHYIGNDASRVRTRMVQITDYMLTEDFAERFHEFVKPMLKKTSERLLREKPETYKGMTAAQEKVLAQKMSLVYKLPLNVCITRPYKVDMESVMLVELLYQIVNNNDVRHKTFQEFLNYADIQYTLFSELMLKETEFEEGFMKYDAFHNYLQETTTDPQFAIAFVLTLSQTAPIDIDAFLDFQKSKFEGKFNRLVSIVIRENESLFTEVQLEVIREWLDNDIPQVEKVSNKTVKQPIEKVIKLHFKTGVAEKLFETLKTSFDESEHGDLMILLKGGTIEGQLYYRGYSVALLTELRDLLFTKEIPSGKSATARWVAAYFKTDNQLNGREQPVSERTATNYFKPIEEKK